MAVKTMKEKLNKLPDYIKSIAGRAKRAVLPAALSAIILGQGFLYGDYNKKITADSLKNAQLSKDAPQMVQTLKEDGIGFDLIEKGDSYSLVYEDLLFGEGADTFRLTQEERTHQLNKNEFMEILKQYSPNDAKLNGADESSAASTPQEDTAPIEDVVGATNLDQIGDEISSQDGEIDIEELDSYRKLPENKIQELLATYSGQVAIDNIEGIRHIEERTVDDYLWFGIPGAEKAADHVRLLQQDNNSFANKIREVIIDYYLAPVKMEAQQKGVALTDENQKKIIEEYAKSLRMGKGGVPIEKGIYKKFLEDPIQARVKNYDDIKLAVVLSDFFYGTVDKELASASDIMLRRNYLLKMKREANIALLKSMYEISEARNQSEAEALENILKWINPISDLYRKGYNQKDKRKRVGQINYANGLLSSKILNPMLQRYVKEGIFDPVYTGLMRIKNTHARNSPGNPELKEVEDMIHVLRRYAERGVVGVDMKRTTFPLIKGMPIDNYDALIDDISALEEFGRTPWSCSLDARAGYNTLEKNQNITVPNLLGIALKKRKTETRIPFGVELNWVFQTPGEILIGLGAGIDSYKAKFTKDNRAIDTSSGEVLDSIKGDEGQGDVVAGKGKLFFAFPIRDAYLQLGAFGGASIYDKEIRDEVPYDYSQKWLGGEFKAILDVKDGGHYTELTTTGVHRTLPYSGTPDKAMKYWQISQEIAQNFGMFNDVWTVKPKAGVDYTYMAPITQIDPWVGIETGVKVLDRLKVSLGGTYSRGDLWRYSSASVGGQNSSDRMSVDRRRPDWNAYMAISTCLKRK